VSSWLSFPRENYGVPGRTRNRLERRFATCFRDFHGCSVLPQAVRPIMGPQMRILFSLGGYLKPNGAEQLVQVVQNPLI
jgi:hypothetical protein